MATIAEVEATVLKMQKVQDERMEKVNSEMKAFMAELVKTMKGDVQGADAEAAGPKDKDPTDKDNEYIKEMFDEQFIKQLKIFDSKQENWKTWVYKFKNAIRIKNKLMWEILEKTETQEE